VVGMCPECVAGRSITAMDRTQSLVMPICIRTFDGSLRRLSPQATPRSRKSLPKPQLEEFGGRNRRLANTGKERNMKIYDWHIAPNPRRLHIYLAEKGIKVDLVEVGQKT
jgi:hypothetical protein